MYFIAIPFSSSTIAKMLEFLGDCQAPDPLLISWARSIPCAHMSSLLLFNPSHSKPREYVNINLIYKSEKVARLNLEFVL